MSWSGTGWDGDSHKEGDGVWMGMGIQIGVVGRDKEGIGDGDGEEDAERIRMGIGTGWRQDWGWELRKGEHAAVHEDRGGKMEGDGDGDMERDGSWGGFLTPLSPRCVRASSTGGCGAPRAASRRFRLARRSTTPTRAGPRLPPHTWPCRASCSSRPLLGGTAIKGGTPRPPHISAPSPWRAGGRGEEG